MLNECVLGWLSPKVFWDCLWMLCLHYNARACLLTSWECELLQMFASTRSEVISTARRPSMQKGGMRNDIHDTRTKTFAKVNVSYLTCVSWLTGTKSSFMSFDNGLTCPTCEFVASRTMKTSLKLILWSHRTALQEGNSRLVIRISLLLSSHSLICHTGQRQICISD